MWGEDVLLRCRDRGCMIGLVGSVSSDLILPSPGEWYQETNVLYAISMSSTTRSAAIAQDILLE
jgi:hypothetical protein